MSTQGLRPFVFLAVLSTTAGGCAAAPPAPWQKPPSPVIQASATEPVASPPAYPPADRPGASPAAGKSSDGDSSFKLSDLDPQNIYDNVKKAIGRGPDEGVARKLMEEGESLFQEKKYAEAAGKFQSAARRWPDSLLEEDAMFMLGESQFFSDQYPKAHDTYGELLKKYENSRHLDTVVARQFAIGRYWGQLHTASPHWPITPNVTDRSRPQFDTFGNMIKAFQQVQEHDPTGPLADDSVMATANAYFVRGRFEDAAYHYDQLRKLHPTSEHQAQAHLLGLQAKLRVYQGAAYDGTPLLEAEQIARQSLAQFRSELGDEKSRVEQALARITQQKAERDWAMAAYYEKKKSFGAARYYYKSILEEYPGTPHAQRARTRLEQIRNEPDEPPNRLKWLTDLVPSEE